jgi:hypothetical protein
VAVNIKEKKKRPRETIEIDMDVPPQDNPVELFFGII